MSPVARRNPGLELIRSESVKLQCSEEQRETLVDPKTGLDNSKKIYEYAVSRTFSVPCGGLIALSIGTLGDDAHTLREGTLKKSFDHDGVDGKARVRVNDASRVLRRFNLFTGVTTRVEKHG